MIARSALGALALVASSALGCSACQSGTPAGQTPSGMAGAAAVSAAGTSVSQSGAPAPTTGATAPSASLDAGTAHPIKLDAATTSNQVDTDADAPDPNAMSAAHPDVRCHADSALPQKTDFSQAGPLAIGTLEVTFTDTSRPIVATDKHASAPARTLVTTIYYPASGPAPLVGSAPLATEWAVPSADVQPWLFVQSQRSQPRREPLGHVRIHRGGPGLSAHQHSVQQQPS